MDVISGRALTAELSRSAGELLIWSTAGEQTRAASKVSNVGNPNELDWRMDAWRSQCQKSNYTYSNLCVLNSEEHISFKKVSLRRLHSVAIPHQDLGGRAQLFPAQYRAQVIIQQRVTLGIAFVIVVGLRKRVDDDDDDSDKDKHTIREEHSSMSQMAQEQPRSVRGGCMCENAALGLREHYPDFCAIPYRSLAHRCRSRRGQVCS